MMILKFTHAAVPAMMVAVLTGCGSAVPAPATVGPNTSPAQATPAPATPAGGPLDAAALCAVFTELAVAALGGPVDQPQFGDVVPRPNGIYCRYSRIGDANTNVEVQLKEMPRDEFESLSETLDATIPLSGVGEAGFRRDSSILGGGGATVVAWRGGYGVTVTLNREDADQAIINAAVEAIANAILIASP